MSTEAEKTTQAAGHAQEGDVPVFNTRDLGLWRHRTDAPLEQEQSDANLIAIVSSAGTVENVISQADSASNSCSCRRVATAS